MSIEEFLTKCEEYIKIQNDEDFEFFIKNNINLVKKYPLEFIGKHVEYYLYEERYDLARNVIKHYQDFDFISMEVEDFLKDLNEEIKKYSSKKENNYDINICIDDILSNNNEKVTRAITFLSKQNARNYIMLFEKLLKSSIKYKFKTLLIYILVEQKIDYSFSLLTFDNKTIKINPSQMVLPFENVKYIDCVNYLNSLNESPEIINNAILALNYYEVKLYPFSIFKEYNDPLVVGEIFLLYAKRCFNIKYDLKNVSLNEEELQLVFNSIDDQINN